MTSRRIRNHDHIVRAVPYRRRRRWRLQRRRPVTIWVGRTALG